MSRLCACIAVDSRITYLLRQSSAGGAKSTNYSLELPAKELFLLLFSRFWPLIDDYGGMLPILHKHDCLLYVLIEHTHRHIRSMSHQKL